MPEADAIYPKYPCEEKNMDTSRLRHAWQTLPWRHWKLPFVVKLLSSFALSVCFLLYSGKHPNTVPGVISYALGNISLLVLTFYAIRYTTKAVRRNQRLESSKKESLGKVLDYEEFKRKHGVN